MIIKFIRAFMQWRGNKEVVKLGVGTKEEIFKSNNWKFKDYYKDAKEVVDE